MTGVILSNTKRHIGNKLTRTPAMVLLDSTPISIGRSHFRNHIEAFCQKTMNPDKNPRLNLMFHFLLTYLIF